MNMKNTFFRKILLGFLLLVVVFVVGVETGIICYGESFGDPIHCDSYRSLQKIELTLENIVDKDFVHIFAVKNGLSIPIRVLIDETGLPLIRQEFYQRNGWVSLSLNINDPVDSIEIEPGGVYQFKVMLVSQPISRIVIPVIFEDGGSRYLSNCELFYFLASHPIYPPKYMKRYSY